MIKEYNQALPATKYFSLYLVLLSFMVLVLKHYGGAEYIVYCLMLVLFASSGIQFAMTDAINKFGKQADECMLLHQSVLQSSAGLLVILMMLEQGDLFNAVFGIYILGTLISVALVIAVRLPEGRA
jgi:hypothetical protein